MIRVTLLWVCVLLGGCVAPPLSREAVCGRYSLGSIDAVFSLTLHSDGSYIESFMNGAEMRSDGNGKAWIEDKEVGRGTWSVSNGRLLLTSQTGVVRTVRIRVKSGITTMEDGKRTLQKETER